MDSRPDLDENLDVAVFRSYYYLKEELIAFCRKTGLQTTGGKLDMTERIEHFLNTGEKLSGNAAVRTAPPRNTDIITESGKIEADFVCSNKSREFFEQKIGKSFSFNVSFQKWLNANAGKTYSEAIQAYYEILSEKKKGITPIGRQFEYNTYIRDFFADNSGKSLDDAIKCWKYKKALQGHNRYEKSDLAVLLSAQP
jgi:hypothetical protein